MAGIGFELRKHLRQESYTALFRAYFVAGIIGSGPWVVSIGSMLFIGAWTRAFGGDEAAVRTFLATVTYLMAASLITSGFLQLLFMRFIADRLFEKKPERVAPNLLGAVVVTTVVSATLGTLAAATLFHGQPVFRAYLITSFVALSDVWILSVLMNGLKAYRQVFAVFVGGYALIVTASLALARFGLPGYVVGFGLGQAAMLFSMLVLVLREYPSREVLAFDFLKRKNVFLDLALAGGVFNLAVWTDKFVFWVNPDTSDQLIGPIRYSVVYDVPIFLAYLSVIPGMAVFFVRIETDFADAYDRFYTAVREGDTLDELGRLRNALVAAARAGLYDICRVQGMTVAILLLAGANVLALFGVPSFYRYLFNVDIVGVGFQVILLGIFTILFYLDYRKLVLYLCSFFAVANLIGSLVTLKLGPRFYGFGFAVAAGLTTLLALTALSRRLLRIDLETFMR